jgi:hypothetical protein
MPEKNDSVNESGCEQVNRRTSRQELGRLTDGINLPFPRQKPTKRTARAVFRLMGCPLVVYE